MAKLTDQTIIDALKAGKKIRNTSGRFPNLRIHLVNGYLQSDIHHSLTITIDELEVGDWRVVEDEQ